MTPFYTNVAKKGNKILLRWVDPDGNKRRNEIEYKPSFFIEGQEHNADARSMHGKPLERVQFQDINEANDFVEKYRDVDGFKVYGQRDIIFQFIADKFPGKVKFDAKQIEVCSCDIEVFSGDIAADGSVIPGPFPEPETALFPISGITCYLKSTKTFYTFGLEVFKGHKVGTWNDSDNPRLAGLNIIYQGYDSEKTLLQAFLSWYEDAAPDLFTGWNSIGFDITYLVNRVERVLGAQSTKRFSVWGQVKKRTFKDGWKEVTTYDMVGTGHLDYLDVFKKHAFIQPDDWKLGTVAEKVLGETKLSYEEAGSLNTLYVTNYEKYITYNIIDTNLVVRIDQKLQLLGVCLTLAYMMKANYEDALGTVKQWSSRLHNDLVAKGIQPELKPLFPGDTQFAGGFVRIPLAGLYRWVVSCDLNSLYPHIMQQWNLGPETIVEPFDLPESVRNIPYFTLDDLLHKRVDLSPLKEHNLTMTANRQFFRRESMSILNSKTREIYADRKEVKKAMLKLEQVQVKIQEEAKRRGLDEKLWK